MHQSDAIPPVDHAIYNRRANATNDTNDNTLDAFITTQFQIDAMLDRLKDLSDNHFEIHPDEINWGHVGSVNHYASLLRQITDAASKECEHAA